MTKIQPQQQDAEPGQDRHVVLGKGLVGHHAQPMQPGMVEDRMLEKQADPEKQQTKQQVQAVQAQKRNSQQSADKDKVQDAENDPGQRKKHERTQRNHAGRNAQNYLTSKEPPRVHTISGRQGQAGAHCQDKGSDDHCPQAQPERVGLKTKMNDPEVVEIETEMIDKHQQHSPASEHVQLGLAPRGSARKLSEWCGAGYGENNVKHGQASKESMVALHQRITGFLQRGQPSLRLLLVLMLLAAVACAPRTGEPPVPPPLLSALTPFGPTMTLSELLEQSLKTQFPPPRVHFPVPEQHAGPYSESAEPFADRFTEGYFMELSREPATLHLASEATAFALAPAAPLPDGRPGSPRRSPGVHQAALAVGHANGDIRIWSNWPCPSVTLPTKGSVSLLTWADAGPYLGAADANNGELHIFDLRHCARVASIPGQRRLRRAALSPSLTWVAMADAGHRLYVGPVSGLTSGQAFGASPALLPESQPTTLHQVGTLRFPPLALAFSPQGGLLQSVDQAGWFLLWSLPEGNLLEQVFIPGGPFDDALFHGRHLILRTTAMASDVSDLVIWDIPNSRLLPPGHLRREHPAATQIDDAPWDFFVFTERFTLDTGLLSFRTAQNHWLRKLHFGKPLLQVDITADNALLRVTEPDQSQRWYAATTGLPFATPSPVPDGLTPLPMTPETTLHWGGQTYALADPVLMRDGFVLLARHLPEHRFFLWWIPARKGVHLPSEAERLPVRKSLLQEIPPAWISLSSHHQPTGDI